MCYYKNLVLSRTALIVVFFLLWGDTWYLQDSLMEGFATWVLP